MKPKVLLSQVFKPWGIDDEYNTRLLNYEAFGSNFSNQDGIWSPRGVCNEIANHFIAANIEAPTVVLDNPTLKSFKAECKKGGYKYIGISSMTMTIKKVKAMIEAAREVAPKAKIVLGGYITQTPGVDELDVDYICREEGSRFFRKLLGEPMNFKYKNPPRVPLVGKSTIFNEALPHPFYNYYFLSLGLGCTRGCHFCSSSAYYDKKYIPLLKTGEDVFNAIMDSSEGLKERKFAIFEDNFTMHKKRNMELWELAREEVDKPIFTFSFNEISATSKYDPEVLAEMGCEVMFVGVETQSQNTTYFNKSKHGNLSKRQIREMFASLHDAGVQTVAASIITGTDEHTAIGYWKDLFFHLSLRPTWSQMAPAIAMPGTGFWSQCETEGRININFSDPNMDLKEWTAVASGYKLSNTFKNLSTFEVAVHVINAYVWDHYLLGPDFFRTYAIKLHAARKYKNSPKKVLKAKAEIQARECYEVLPFFYVGERRDGGLPLHVRAWIGIMRRRIERSFGKPTSDMRDKAEEYAKLAARERKSNAELLGTPVEAKTRRTEYNITAKKKDTKKKHAKTSRKKAA